MFFVETIVVAIVDEGIVANIEIIFFEMMIFLMWLKNIPHRNY